MTLEDFKEVYRDKPPLEKLNLLIEALSRRADAQSISAVERQNENREAEQHWTNEMRAASARARWLHEEITNVLKAQEPRMMMEGEVTASKEGTVLWVEERQGVTWNLFPLEIETSSTHPDTGTDYLFFITYHDIRKFECDEYNRTWRCWTKRPTDAQREATPWE